ncbi:MAG: CpaF family protein [Bacteriovoracaceae bacterium]
MNPEENSVWSLLQELSKKKGITEVAINDSEHVFVEREGRFIQLQFSLKEDDILQFVKDVATINQKPCDERNPILDGNLPDGSRINVIHTPYAKKSPAITIRKYLRFIKKFEHDERIFKLTPKWVELLRSLVMARKNIIISGGTGAGKTTLLNLMAHEVDPTQRVVVIEDTKELDIRLPNTVSLESRKSSASTQGLTMRDLVKNSLRMRPDRIVLGEVRGSEMFDLLQAMNTGHEGCLSTIHANSPGECLIRMETLYLMGTTDIPMMAVRRQISMAVDFIVQIGFDRQGRRQLEKVLEITGMEGDTITSQTILELNPESNEIEFSGFAPKCFRELIDLGNIDENFFS